MLELERSLKSAMDKDDRRGDSSEAKVGRFLELLKAHISEIKDAIPDQHAAQAMMEMGLP